MSLLWFILISYGLTQIIVYGKIFDKIRPTRGWLGELLSCPMCAGFWVGLFLWSVKDYTQLFTFDDHFVTAFLVACASSAAAYMGNTLFGDEGFRVEKILHLREDNNETSSEN